MKIILLILGIVFAGCTARISANISSTPNPNNAFESEGQPQEIGWSKVYILKEKQTGHRFIFTESSASSSGGRTMTLIPSSFTVVPN